MTPKSMLKSKSNSLSSVKAEVEVEVKPPSQLKGRSQSRSRTSPLLLLPLPLLPTSTVAGTFRVLFARREKPEGIRIFILIAFADVRE